MRKLRAGLVIAMASACVVSAPNMATASRPTADPGVGQVTDPKLLAEITQAQSRRVEGDPQVTVELLTSDPATVAAEVTALGGTVTGAVPGALVQADVPISQIQAIAGARSVQHVQAPRSAGYVPTVGGRRTEAVLGTGPTAGSEVTSTNADVWQMAGYLGAGVKIGIIDYFDFTLWDTAENGPIPDGAHQFCQDTPAYGLCNAPNSIADEPFVGDHGVAVAEIIKDMAPSAEIYLATIATTADLQAAIDYFATNGVTIINRSLGAAYDGPGDGTGPLAAVVNSTVGKGMTWFNSAGNDAQDEYMKRSVPTNLGANAYVNFNDGRPAVGPTADTWLRIDAPGCFTLDGIRWSNDWNLPANQRTDYSVEFWQPTFDVTVNADSFNPTTGQVAAIDLSADGGTGTGHNIIDASQAGGANPLEAADLTVCPSNTYSQYFASGSVSYIRIKRNATTTVGATPDQLEIALSDGFLELYYYDINGSAAKPVVDSKNVGLVAVGAVESDINYQSDPYGIAYYSSQGPTTDGRIKPDVTAPAGFASATLAGAFHGTSAASPTAAGFAALLAGAGLGQPGGGMGALVRHFTSDVNAAVAPGPDNAYGAGVILFPGPPSAAIPATPGKYVPLDTPARILDTRAGANHIGPVELTGPYNTQSIIEANVLDGTLVPTSGVSAVAINLTSVDSKSIGFVQAYPYLRAATGATSTLNVSTVAAARPNFAIVPVGVDGNISIYMQAGGNVVVDLLGYFADGQTTTAEGRFVPLAEPERWMDTRGIGGAPLPAVFSGTPRQVAAGETVDIPVLAGTAVPDITVPSTTVQALVVNVTATGSLLSGFLRVIPKGTVGATHANVNFSYGSSAANTVIVPIGTNQGISIFTNRNADIVVDVVGYITSTDATVDQAGLFVPTTPTRVYNTIAPTSNPFAANEVRSIEVSGGATGVPTGVGGVSANLAVTGASANGFLKVFPGLTQPATSSLNYATAKTVANGALLSVNQGATPADPNTVSATMNRSGHLIIDINGYFLEAAPI